LAAQLQALARAAKDTGADLCVVGPMVATPAEAAGFVQVARLQGLDRVGVVVAVPAAALRAGDLLAEVDMVSVAIDELAQLTFAADPGLPELADLLDPWQPAVLELLAGVARAGRGAGRPVSMCVWDVGDPLLALVLAGLGATSLSMAPRGVAAVRDALAARSLDECRVLAELALAAPTAEEARAAVADASE
jgi:phosphotransferase system enzyme I (PtsI)